MVVGGLGLKVFGVASVADFGESETTDVLGSQTIVYILLVKLAFWSMEVDDGLDVELERHVRQ